MFKPCGTLFDLFYLVLPKHFQQIAEKFLVLVGTIAIVGVFVSLHCPLEFGLNSIMWRRDVGDDVRLRLETVKTDMHI